MPWRLVDHWNFTQLPKFESFLTHHMTQRNSGPDCAARLLAPRDLKRGEAGEAIVNAVIAMGMGLKQRVVAKGIETEQQLTFCRPITEPRDKPLSSAGPWWPRTSSIYWQPTGISGRSMRA